MARAAASTTAKKAPAKKAAVKKAAVKKAPVKKAAVKKAPVKKAAVKKAPAKKAPAKKAAAKKAPATAPVKKAAVKKAPAPAPAKKAAVKKAPAAAPAPKVAVRKLLAKKEVPAVKKLTKSPYDKQFIKAQEALLDSERARLTRDVSGLMDEANELAAMREPGDVQFDEESGEGDTLAVERERDLALSAQFLAQIEEIDHAYTKIKAGTYGICEVSGQSIPKERLEAIPWARERVEYKVGGFARF